ncbi:hypothetical protein J3F83DRAFT_437243 [Trichoderma novae-zelandiae]
MHYGVHLCLSVCFAIRCLLGGSTSVDLTNGSLTSHLKCSTKHDITMPTPGQHQQTLKSNLHCNNRHELSLSLSITRSRRPCSRQRVDPSSGGPLVAANGIKQGSCGSRARLVMQPEKRAPRL